MDKKCLGSYTLIDIVERVNGGDFIPRGDSTYDEKAYDRQIEIQGLIEYLIVGFHYIHKFRTRPEWSYERAGLEAEEFLKSLKKVIEEILDEEST